MTKKTKQRRNLYQEITDAVITSLEGNVIPWEKPWFSAMTAPRSVSTGKLYRGSNTLILGMQPYASPWWLTFNQAKKLEGTVRLGETSTVAVYWMFLDEKKDGKKTGKRIPMLRHYNMFNVEQCDLPQEVLDRLAARLDRLVGKQEFSDAIDDDAIANAATVTNDYLTREHITLNHGGSSAFYRPSADAITMPEADTFRSPEAYAFTLLHECMHSTGHSSRLDRGLDTQLAAFGSETYSREELVAELGAAFAGGVLNITRPEVETNRNAYIKNWIKVLKDDPKAVIWAGGRASKASDMVLNVADDNGEAEEALVYNKG